MEYGWDMRDTERLEAELEREIDNKGKVIEKHFYFLYTF